MWIEGNIGLPTLCKAMKDPEQKDFQEKVVRYVDDVFAEHLDVASARAESSYKALQDGSEIVKDEGELGKNFKLEANFASHCTVLHTVQLSAEPVSPFCRLKDSLNPCRLRDPYAIFESNLLCPYTQSG
jgi:hypothetical protein